MRRISAVLSMLLICGVASAGTKPNFRKHVQRGGSVPWQPPRQVPP